MKYLYILLFLITSTLVSCVEDDTNGVSKITNYPIITINGPSELILAQGASYTDAGAVSTEGDVEIETTTSFSKGAYYGADFGTSSPDQYVVTYSAINKDGFAGNALKSILVKPSTGNLTSDLSGLYLADVQRGPTYAATAQYTGMKYIFIKKVSANTFAISDAVGGYYDLGRGYGTAYAATGATITVNNMAANNFSFTPGPIAAFGITLNMSDMVVNAASKTITFTTAYGTSGSSFFKVQLKQVQL